MADSVWWTKVMHKDFCAHYCEMSDAEIVADVRRSIASLMMQRADGEDFGASMVRTAMQRINDKHDTAVSNGSQGGRPRNNKENSEDGDISTDEALDLLRAGVMDTSPAPTSKGPAAMPADVGEVYAFAAAEGLDSVDAYECWSATVARDGRTADGRKVRNWKAYVRRWCATRAKKRRTA